MLVLSRSLALLGTAVLAGCYGHAKPGPGDATPTAAPMATIPAGTFTMGDRNGEPDEYPERQVRVSAFRIDRVEVSNARYAACVRAQVCDPTRYAGDPGLGAPEHPVVGVTFEDAARFCRWVGRRLPTEAEWEYAARGEDLRRWPWRGVFDRAKANTSEGGGTGTTAPVDSFPEGESPFGVRNLAGNVAEWVADYFDPTHYRTSAILTDPRGPERGRERVVRGGSYRDVQHLVRVSARRAKLPTEADNTTGFRCAGE
jgi:formylglycine-generating enzyme required for sulfatase activity